MIFIYDFEGETFEYHVDVSEVLHVLKNVILKEKSKEELIDIIMNIDGDVEEYFMDELSEYFEEDAIYAFEEACAFDEDPMGYYGLSIGDFI
jgi:hypothetical protein